MDGARMDEAPEAAGEEIRPHLDPRLPDPEGVVLYLLTPRERVRALEWPGVRWKSRAGWPDFLGKRS
jgi:hypothetical protein